MHLFLLFFLCVLFPPYHFLVDSDFLTYRRNSSTCSDLSNYSNDFPILDHYLFIPSPASHYQVFRNLVSEHLFNKSDDQIYLKLLTDFSKIMPEYPSEIISPFSESISMQLKQSAPEVFATINLINPELIPKSTIEDPNQQTIEIIRNILIQQSQYEIDQQIQILNDKITPEIAIQNEILIGKMLQQLFQRGKTSTTVYLFMKSLLDSIPKTILFLDIAFPKSVDFMRLKTISFYSKKTINQRFLSNIELYKFAYLVVENMQTSFTVESIVPLHRLTLSGGPAIEAVLFALIQFPKTLTIFRKNAEHGTKIALGSIFVCLLTCVEIPLLKQFVMLMQNRIIKYFKPLCYQVKSVAINRSFRNILNLFNCRGITPLNHVYSCWLNKPRKFLILNCLCSISPLDPSFPVLLIESCRFLLDFPYLICEMVRKIVFNPSIYKSKAIEVLAEVVQSSMMNDFILFADSILKTDLYFYAVHLISFFSDIPDMNRKGIQTAIENLIFMSVLSESIYSAQHLETFCKWLTNLDQNSMMNIIDKSLKFYDSRISCRLFLMITYIPNISEYMSNNTQFASHLLESYSNFYGNDLNDSLLNCLCITWHNLFMSIKEYPETMKSSSEVKQMFLLGTKKLVRNWDIQNKLMIESFCDSLLNDDTRKIVIENIGVKQTNNQQFLDQLYLIDPAATKQKFPGLINHHPTSLERLEPVRWGWSFWESVAFGQAMSVRI